VEGLEGPLRVRMLDAGNALEAMQAPEVYREREERGAEVGELELPPYAVVRVDGGEV